MVDNNNRAYEEIQLPFDTVQRDYINGEVLEDAVKYAFQSTEKYDVNIDEGTIRAYRGSKIKNLLSMKSRPYLELDIALSQRHSHLAADIVYESKGQLEDITAELEDIEVQIGSYMEENLEQINTLKFSSSSQQAAD